MNICFFFKTRIMNLKSYSDYPMYLYICKDIHYFHLFGVLFLCLCKKKNSYKLAITEQISFAPNIFNINIYTPNKNNYMCKVYVTEKEHFFLFMCILFIDNLFNKGMYTKYICGYNIFAIT